MTDDELYSNAENRLSDLKIKFGYDPYILKGVDNGKIIAECPFCGTEIIFNSEEELSEFSELPDVSGELKPINACPECIASRKEGKNSKY